MQSTFLRTVILSKAKDPLLFRRFFGRKRPQNDILTIEKFF